MRQRAKYQEILCKPALMLRSARSPLTSGASLVAATPLLSYPHPSSPRVP
jgi:hypothetical protein